MDPQVPADPTFRDDVALALAEDRPAVLVSLAPAFDGQHARTEVALTDGLTRADAADLLDYAAATLRGDTV